MFQSTHPYRVWHSRQSAKICLQGFNPHTHTGCDFRVVASPSQLNVSIHTPIQGVTVQGTHLAYQRICFNPHTHTGCDVSNLSMLNPWTVSIHTPIQGVTSALEVFQHSGIVSIHTPIQGVTGKADRFCVFCRFQSTHPYRVWPSDWLFFQYVP